MRIIPALLVMLAVAPAPARAQRRDVQRAVLRAVMAQPGRDTLAVTCVSLAGVDADSGLLAPLQARGRGAVVPFGRCPPTYEPGERSGPVLPPRPPGARDPHQVTLERVVLLRSGAARVDVTEIHGATATMYRCTAVRRSAGWSATCRLTGAAIF